MFSAAGVSMQDRHLSYLPLPHIFERFVVAQLLSNGASIAFFRGDPTQLIEDLQACRPTILPAAPRVLNKVYDKVRTVTHKSTYLLPVCALWR
jgi:long-chain acyl-CoA synthetase